MRQGLLQSQLLSLPEEGRPATRVDGRHLRVVAAVARFALLFSQKDVDFPMDLFLHQISSMAFDNHTRLSMK
jgi:hypothetical protein